MTPNATRIAVIASFFFATLGLAATQNPSIPANPVTPPVITAHVTPPAQDKAPDAGARVDVETTVGACLVDSPSGGEAATDLGATADRGQGSCGHGIKACDASQVGQPCDPSNLNIICSKQSNGHYCCLAYAP